MASNNLKVFALSLLMLLMGIGEGYAQTWNEFFRQKKTQQKYLLEQLTALKLYTGYLKKGYELVSGGLSTIKDISNGEFGLHDAFISGLKKVSPVMKNNTKVTEIIQMQLATSRAFSALNADPNLTVSNLAYIAEVRENLWQESLKDLEELLLVVTSGRMEMSDSERINRLDLIYLSMVEKSAFVQHFCTEIQSMIRQREIEENAIKEIRSMYGN
ncbi:hypothetical protein D9M68_569760 [compost metagenome]